MKIIEKRIVLSRLVVELERTSNSSTTCEINEEDGKFMFYLTESEHGQSRQVSVPYHILSAAVQVIEDTIKNSGVSHHDA